MKSNKLNWFRVLQLVLIIFTILDQIEGVFSKHKDGKCENNEFKCDNGECINNLYVCNGYDECGDGSDEPEEECQNRKCEYNQFRCSNGQCIPLKWVCDQNYDCFYKEDEDKCYYFS